MRLPSTGVSLAFEGGRGSRSHRRLGADRAGVDVVGGRGGFAGAQPPTQGPCLEQLAEDALPDLHLDLGEAQSLKVREELARLQQWHRGTELPKIAELLQKTQQLALADTTPEQVCALFADIRSRIASGQDIAGLVPAPVASYIARHSLYQGKHT